MRSDQQWTAGTFQTHWLAFKRMHPEFANFDYTLAGDVIIINGPGLGIGYNAGYVWDIGSWQYISVENHFLNVLRVQEQQYQEKRKMTEQQKERVQGATEKGQMWARFLLAINPSMDREVVEEMSLELAELYGYGLTKETMAFYRPIKDAFKKYDEEHTDFLTKAIEQAKMSPTGVTGIVDAKLE